MDMLVFVFNKCNHLFDTIPMIFHWECAFFFENNEVSAMRIQSKCNKLKNFEFETIL